VVIGTLTVRPPAPLDAYTVPDVRLAPSRVAGGGGMLPTFVTRPYVDFVGELLYRRSGGPLSWSVVTFRRTGGARLATGDVLVTGAGPDGWFHLQGAADGTEPIDGELIVRTNDFARPLVVTGVQLPVRYTDRLSALDRSFRIGATADYVIELRRRGTGAPLAGAEVEFRRTGGLPLLAERFVGRADAQGRVALQLSPAAEASGEVVGELTVRAAALARPYVVREVRLRAYDGDEIPFLGVIGVGVQAVAVGELTRRGDRSPLGGRDVEFVRTGGVPTTPERTTVRTLPDGRFGITLAADSAGEVVGDLTVRVSDGAAPTIVRGVRLRAAADDSVRFVGRWGVGQQLLAVGQLMQRATNVPAVGWSVTFRRTAGSHSFGTPSRRARSTGAASRSRPRPGRRARSRES
jgi:hypothetical protein